jgi:hypothetical protein
VAVRGPDLHVLFAVFSGVPGQLGHLCHCKGKFRSESQRRMERMRSGGKCRKKRVTVPWRELALGHFRVDKVSVVHSSLRLQLLSTVSNISPFSLIRLYIYNRRNITSASSDYTKIKEKKVERKKEQKSVVKKQNKKF